MKLKMIIMIALIWIGQSTFGQVSETKNDTIENTNSEDLKEKDTKDTLIKSVSEQDISYNSKNETFYSEKEWKKVKRQIRRNKKRITSNRDGIHNSKILDTVYLEIKIPKTNSQITDW
ncbi:hypothetical protein [uncultured Aquimarina sp.]|uniref:hypothetical protein n=1 Tax=uncultured Aquimarina sp. TaxID=575652 RepID=UPI00261C7CC8|nr:hypothetical protein [uncultured Aquimarina sp.]